MNGRGKRVRDTSPQSTSVGDIAYVVFVMLDYSRKMGVLNFPPFRYRLVGSFLKHKTNNT